MLSARFSKITAICILTAVYYCISYCSNYCNSKPDPITLPLMDFIRVRQLNSPDPGQTLDFMNLAFDAKRGISFITNYHGF